MSVTLAEINTLILDRTAGYYNLKRRRKENDSHFTARILIAAWDEEMKQHGKLVKWLRGKKPVRITAARMRIPLVFDGK